MWQGFIPSQAYPELFSFVKNKSITHQRAVATVPFHRLFHLPLSEIAFEQMQILEIFLQSIITSQDSDIWNYIWGNNAYSSTRAYKQITGHALVHPAFKWIWKSSCQNKHIVFSWLLLRDRLSTRNILRRKTMDLPSFDCVLCNPATEETLEHLFFGCPFAQQCWNFLNIQLPPQSTAFEADEGCKHGLQSPLFMSCFILLCWAIWTARNNLIFQSLPPTLQGCRSHFKKELGLLMLRAKPSHQVLLEEWLNNFT
jgi:hypothetical protein